MSFFLALRALLAPPALNILLTLFGLWLLRRRRLWTGRVLILLGLGGLWLLASPLGAALLAAGLTLPAEPDAASLPARGAQAIVILGGGRESAPEFGGQDMPNYWTASRLRYGAALYRQTGLPVLVSGGRVQARDVESEAAVMARSLVQDHIVNVRWQESQSRTTWENAQYSRELLAPEGIQRVVLVTQALHMRRARLAFRHAGFTVLAAPTDLPPPLRWSPSALLPNLSAFVRSQQALHEYGGLLWYRLRALAD